MMSQRLWYNFQRKIENDREFVYKLSVFSLQICQRWFRPGFLWESKLAAGGRKNQIRSFFRNENQENRDNESIEWNKLIWKIQITIKTACFVSV